MTEVAKQTPSELVESINISLGARRPMMIWGSPGIGKSDIISQVAAANKIDLRDVRMLLLDPVDLRGIPKVNGNGQAEWCPPVFLPQDPKSKGILFLDELPSATQLVQNSGLSLCLDRRIGEYELPDGWHVIAAGNLETDRAFTHRMTTALANRFIHAHLTPHAPDWISWAYNAGVDPMVIAYIDQHPEHLMTFDPKSNEKAFASPRSWEFMSDIVKQGPSDSVLFKMAQGTVGSGPAGEFVAFVKTYLELPDWQQIIDAPKTAEIPEKQNVMFALLVAIAYNTTENNFENVITYALRLQEEWSTKLVKDIVRKDKSLMKHHAYGKWASKNYKAMV